MKSIALLQRPASAYSSLLHHHQDVNQLNGGLSFNLKIDKLETENHIMKVLLE